MKKVLSLFMIVLMLFILVGCNFSPSNNGNTNNELEQQETYQIYRLAATSGYEGTYEEWLKSIKGEKGDSGVGIASITKTGSDGLVDVYTVTFTDGSQTSFSITNGAQGPQGEKGETGTQGEKGDTGVGIVSIIKTSSEGLVDTYTITLTDGTTTTFNITNGNQGLQGEKGDTGVGISSIAKTSSEGLMDTYTITFTDNSQVAFSVNNGSQGEKGDTGSQGEKGDTGSQGEKGETGKSAFETFKEYYPDYNGTEKEWITDVAMGNVCNLFGHQWDEGIVTKEPQKGINGEKTFTCSICHEHKYEVIPMLEVVEAEIYEENGIRYVNFGSYPQSHISDATIIEELDKLTETNSRGYYEYNGKEYARYTAWPYQYGQYTDNYGNHYNYMYSDGANVRFDWSGVTEYFLVEPIKWRILDENDGEFLLLAEYILDAQCYYGSGNDRLIDGETVHPNNYMYSYIREFINNDFINSAFNDKQKAAILTKEIENGAIATGYVENANACANTFDKVFILSYEEAVLAKYGFANANSRVSKVTDFAKAHNTVYSTDENYMDNGYWWLRAPNATDVNEATRAKFDGDFDYFAVVYPRGLGYGEYTGVYGVRPACWVYIDDGKIKIDFDSNGGNDVSPIRVYKNSSVSELPIPTWEGHTFIGWTLNGNLVSLPINLTENKTFVASWEVTVTDFEYTNEGDGSVTITKYIGSDSKVIVPNTIGGKSVKTIAEGTFEGKSNVKEIVLGANVTQLEFKSLYGCFSLEKLTISGNVGGSLKYFFGNNEDNVPLTLKEIVFAEGSSTYSKDLFADLSEIHLFKIYLPSNVTTTPADAFYGCINIEEAFVPEGIRTISTRTFCACTNLKKVNIPSTCTSIGMNCFINLPNLTYLIIPNNTTSFDYAALAATSSVLLFERTEKITGSVFSIYEDSMAIYYGFEQIKENGTFKYALCKVGVVKQCIILSLVQGVDTPEELPEEIDGYPVVFSVVEVDPGE